eukprot:7390501-Prymnesium_polylepis.4
MTQFACLSLSNSRMSEIVPAVYSAMKPLNPRRRSSVPSWVPFANGLSSTSMLTSSSTMSA